MKHGEFWNLIMEIYTALRKSKISIFTQSNVSKSVFYFPGGHTIVLKASRKAKLAYKQQRMCLGVYRVVKERGDKLMYAQVEGDHILYFRASDQTWYVGSGTDQEFGGWIRNK